MNAHRTFLIVEAKLMTQEQSARRTNGWGIDLTYEDALGNWHDTEQATVDALLKAMDAEPGSERPDKSDCVLFVKRGEARRIGESGSVTLESGGQIPFATDLPFDLPTGYHELKLDSSDRTTSLIVSPEKCWMPEDLSEWGWAVQLYSARSSESWGIGDFADLDRLARWSADELGAGMMLLNPLSSATPILPQQTSPYFPTSRIFLNPLWLHIEWIPGASAAAVPDWDDLVRAAHELNGTRVIDRDRIFVLKMRALESLWPTALPNAEFEAFCKARGQELERYALFCTLAEHFKSGWHSWPEQFQNPKSPEIAKYASENSNRIRFHQWVQFLLDQQLQRCANHLALMQDLPIGVDPDGADAWAWQDYLAAGVGVGAPPDEFNTQGQSWGLPPFVPHKLRGAAYRPFIQTIRAAFRHGGGLRIDHVMGLFRLFWIPAGASAAQGGYVRYNPDEMLAIVALESERARAYVVGEDLGTVEEDARQKLTAWGVLSYRLLWFEKSDAVDYPKEALAAVTTHDLPTVAGMWSEQDVQRQRELGLNPNEESLREIRDRVQQITGVDEDADMEEVIVQAYAYLAKAPSRILTAALDDAAVAFERPNVPATTGEQSPNWCLALPAPLEKLVQSDLARRIATALRRGKQREL